jgi:hypothetical protein
MNSITARYIKLSIKKVTFIRIFTLFIAAIYGLFIVSALQFQYSAGSGDIGAYLYFFNQFQRGAEAPELTLRQDGAFRLAIFFLREFFNIEVLTILSIFAFIMALVFFYLFSRNIRSESQLIYFLPLLMMVFTTPVVQVLFSSNIRSGVAFTILFLAMTQFKGLIRWSLFAVAIIVHLSMLPFIGFYMMFNFLKRINFNGRRLPIVLTYFLLIGTSIFFAIFGSFAHVDTAVNTSFAYNLSILYIACFLMFLDGSVVRNIFGFIAVGLTITYFAGMLIDVSYSRYIGNALLLYFLFLVQRGKRGTVMIYSVAFAPFYLLTTFYAVANNL